MNPTRVNTIETIANPSRDQSESRGAGGIEIESPQSAVAASRWNEIYCKEGRVRLAIITARDFVPKHTHHAPDPSKSFTASRSEASSAAEASIRRRASSSIGRPFTMVQVVPSEVSGKL